jgi:hypothetical protein
MLKQALIVIAIGIYLAAAILLDRTIAAYVERNEKALRDSAESSAVEKESLANLKIFRRCILAFHAVVIFCLMVWFIEFGRRVYRYHFSKNQPPNDDDELIRRLSGKMKLPFQFSILTLLAAMVAVAIVCSAYRLSLQIR